MSYSNPLDRLIETKLHTSGRREDRRGLSMKMNARFARPEDAQEAILRGEPAKTLPITRKVPKRPSGMSARQWKRQQRAGRQGGEISVRGMSEEAPAVLDSEQSSAPQGPQA